MDFFDILAAQLAEPFRIGLLVALVVTSANTAAATGTIFPLLLGVAFVAVLIPTTLGADSGDRMTAILVGFVSNAIIVAIIMALKAAYTRLSRR